MLAARRTRAQAARANGAAAEARARRVLGGKKGKRGKRVAACGEVGRLHPRAVAPRSERAARSDAGGLLRLVAQLGLGDCTWLLSPPDSGDAGASGTTSASGLPPCPSLPSSGEGEGGASSSGSSGAPGATAVLTSLQYAGGEISLIAAERYHDSKARTPSLLGSQLALICRGGGGGRAAV